MPQDNNDQQVVQLETAFRALHQATASFRERVFAGLNLTRTQVEILFLLSESPTPTTSELAGRLCLTQGSVTQTVETLVRRGLVDRQPSSQDRRVIHLVPSETGRTITDRLREARRQHLLALVSELTETELNAMITATKRLTQLLQEHQS